MFEDFKVANYPKSLVSPELYARPLARLFSGDVIDGLTVTPGTGLQVVLAPGNAMLRYGSAAVASARIASLVANFNLTIETADVSNPRIDLVVLYIDNAVNLPDGTPSAANLDGKGVAKAKIVKGTAAATPAAPNATAIQSSVGAGNPYTVLARVRVNAGVSVIAANQITDIRNLARTAKIDPETLSFGNYSTTEKQLPFTWVDGKPIYRKTVNCGALPNNTTKDVAHGISGLATVVNLYGSFTNGTIHFAENRIDPNDITLGIGTFINGANITLMTKSNRSSFTGYVTIEYTKT